MVKHNNSQCCYRENVKLDFPFYNNEQLYHFQYNDANCLNNAQLYTLFFPDLKINNNKAVDSYSKVLDQVFNFPKVEKVTKDAVAEVEVANENQ